MLEGKVTAVLSIYFNRSRTELSHSQDLTSTCSRQQPQTNIFIHVICVIEISEDEDSDDSEEDLEHTKHVGDQNGGQSPQAKKLRR